MARYAEGTTVSIEASQQEALRIIRKYGAEGHLFGEDPQGNSFLAFSYKGLPVHLKIRRPGKRRDGRDRGPTELDAEKRRLWRVMVLWIKGKFEAIENDLVTPMQAFLSDLHLKDGSTVAEAVERDPAALGNVSKSLPMLPAPEDVKP